MPSLTDSQRAWLKRTLGIDVDVAEHEEVAPAGPGEEMKPRELGAKYRGEDEKATWFGKEEHRETDFRVVHY